MNLMVEVGTRHIHQIHSNKTDPKSVSLVEEQVGHDNVKLQIDEK